MNESIGDEIATDAQIHLAASDFAADFTKYLWPMDTYWSHFHAKVKSYREQGLSHDADLLNTHVPVLDDGLACMAESHDEMPHEQCPVVQHLWPEVTAAYEEMCQSFRDNPMPGDTTEETA